MRPGIVELILILVAAAWLTHPRLGPVQVDGVWLGEARADVGPQPGVEFTAGRVSRVEGRVAEIPGVGRLQVGDKMDTVRARLGDPDGPGCTCDGFSYSRYPLYVEKGVDPTRVGSIVLRP